MMDQMADVPMRFDVHFGYVQIVPVQEFVNGRLRMGGYSIKRDRHGQEVSRTEVTWHGSIGYDDGTSLTPAEVAAWEER